MNTELPRIARDEKRRRKPGICKSCCSPALVRPRSFWTTGLRMPLCAKCERQFTLNTGRYVPPVVTIHDPRFPAMPHFGNIP